MQTVPKTNVFKGIEVAKKSVTYQECMRNYAASMGRFVGDGCGEFMKSEGETTLICAACGCQRNFHRQKMLGSEHCDNFHHSLIASEQDNNLGLMPRIDRNGIVHHSLVKTGEGYDNRNGDGRSDTPGTQNIHTRAVVTVAMKKRFRTKFSHEKKMKMRDFAERIGWKMKRVDDLELNRFCDQVGVNRKKFEVWMQNNKNVHHLKVAREQSRDVVRQPEDVADKAALPEETQSNGA